jgi:hypothetical protein
MKWDMDYRDSQVWLETSYSDYSIRLSSWGPHAEVGRGRYSDRKSWTVEFLVGSTMIAYGGTWAQAGRDVTDDEAKGLALDMIDRWLTRALDSLRTARRSA